MAASIDDFMTAIDRWAERVEGEADSIYTLVLIAVGRFGNDHGDSGGSLDDFVEQIRSGAHSRRYRMQFEQSFRSLIAGTGIRETFLIVGAVRYIEWFLEDTLENAAKRRQGSAAQLQEYRDMLSDPAEAQHAADRQNRLRHPDMPEVTAEDVRDSIDDMEARYAPPITLDQLKEYRKQLDAWRSFVVPILYV